MSELCQAVWTGTGRKTGIEKSIVTHQSVNACVSNQHSDIFRVAIAKIRIVDAEFFGSINRKENRFMGICADHSPVVQAFPAEGPFRGDIPARTERQMMRGKKSHPSPFIHGMPAVSQHGRVVIP